MAEPEHIGLDDVQRIICALQSLAIDYDSASRSPTNTEFNRERCAAERDELLRLASVFRAAFDAAAVQQSSPEDEEVERQPEELRQATISTTIAVVFGIVFVAYCILKAMS